MNTEIDISYSRYGTNELINTNLQKKFTAAGSTRQKHQIYYTLDVRCKGVPSTFMPTENSQVF